MKIESCFYIGFSQKLIGTQGELAFKLDVDSPSSYANLDHVLIQIQEQDQQLVPFFISNCQLQNKGILRCKLEGVDSQAEAKDLIGKGLYLPLELLPPLEGNQFYFHEIIGFQAIEKTSGALGPVNKVFEYPSSNLLSIDSKGKEVLIPINDETVLAVDRKKKEIHLQAPEGLIELYLEG